MTPLFVALAGSLGAVCRFVVDGHLKAAYSPSFPWATVIINVSGSLILGVVTGLALRHHISFVAAVVGVGFCGGYTTFSTASFETARLLERKKYTAALKNALGGLVAACLAAGIGMAAGTLL